ncbi:hypothetical protein Ciccas_002544 [Cichlidogyrus casuarinus]|uniref:Uncharacterized protein n=1 Tax=Cichlidogyrus casuarinus TaxID=1844966 RepID=A0ABD2QH73_9PLAT
MSRKEGRKEHKRKHKRSGSKKRHHKHKKHRRKSESHESMSPITLDFVSHEVSSCVCSNPLCSFEKSELREELSKLKSKYSVDDLAKDVCPLENYANLPSKLLYEVWQTLSMKRIAELLPEDLNLFVEQGEKSSEIQDLPRLLNPNDEKLPLGVKFLWSAYLKELGPMNSAEIQKVLNNESAV